MIDLKLAREMIAVATTQGAMPFHVHSQRRKDDVSDKEPPFPAERVSRDLSGRLHYNKNGSTGILRFITPARLGRNQDDVHWMGLTFSSTVPIPDNAIICAFIVVDRSISHFLDLKIQGDEIVDEVAVTSLVNFIELANARQLPVSAFSDGRKAKTGQRKWLTVAAWGRTIRFIGPRDKQDMTNFEWDNSFADSCELAKTLNELHQKAAVIQAVSELRDALGNSLDNNIDEPFCASNTAALDELSMFLGPGKPEFCSTDYVADVLKRRKFNVASVSPVEKNEQSSLATEVSAVQVTATELAELKTNATAERPFWFGKFWCEQSRKFQPPLESVFNAAACIKHLSNAPHPSVVAEAKALRPEAAEMLDRWTEIWNRSFPGWQAWERWSLHECEMTREEYLITHVENAFDWVDQNKSANDGKVMEYLDGWISADRSIHRDHRLHIIDDADAVTSMVHSMPGVGYFDVIGQPVRYDGLDEDGLPRFSLCFQAKELVRKRMESCPDYWNWDFFKKYLGRRGVVTKGLKHTVCALADMALQGHDHAFLKGISQKSGTWTVNLTTVCDLETAELALREAVDAEMFDKPMYLQEHLPFTHEQRFYVQNGRLFASSCSDRHFCMTDSTGKRLDGRIATLVEPSVDKGAYDRGLTRHVQDRKTAAKFARQVRKITAELKTHGILDYSIDLGLTERGMVAVEVNTLHRAGPYNLQRDFYTKQFARSQKQAEAQLREEVVRILATMYGRHTQSKTAIEIAERSPALLAIVLRMTDQSPGENAIVYAMDVANFLMVAACVEHILAKDTNIREAA